MSGLQCSQTRCETNSTHRSLKVFNISMSFSRANSSQMLLAMNKKPRLNFERTFTIEAILKALVLHKEQTTGQKNWHQELCTAKVQQGSDGDSINTWQLCVLCKSQGCVNNCVNEQTEYLFDLIKTNLAKSSIHSVE